jgi:hypothetical protein
MKPVMFVFLCSLSHLATVVIKEGYYISCHSVNSLEESHRFISAQCRQILLGEDGKRNRQKAGA